MKTVRTGKINKYVWHGGLCGSYLQCDGYVVCSYCYQSLYNTVKCTHCNLKFHAECANHTRIGYRYIFTCKACGLGGL